VIWPLDTKKPLESFFPRLTTLRAVEEALRRKFGKRTPAIITNLKTGQLSSHEMLHARDIISDLVGNNSEHVKTLSRQREKDQEQDDVPFVNIMRYGTGRGHCVYWIDHMDFPGGYFGSKKDAEGYAGLMYIA
jgi:hypothetical protein